MKLLSMMGLFATLLCSGTLAALQVGEKGPDFSFDKSWNTLEGATRLSDYKDKVVLVEIWATW